MLLHYGARAKISLLHMHGERHSRKIIINYHGQKVVEDAEPPDCGSFRTHLPRDLFGRLQWATGRALLPTADDIEFLAEKLSFLFVP